MKNRRFYLSLFVLSSLLACGDDSAVVPPAAEQPAGGGGQASGGAGTGGGVAGAAGQPNAGASAAGAGAGGKAGAGIAGQPSGGQGGSGPVTPVTTSGAGFLESYCSAIVKKDLQVLGSRLIPGTVDWESTGNHLLMADSLVFREADGLNAYGFLADGSVVSFQKPGGVDFDDQDLQHPLPCDSKKQVYVFFGDVTLQSGDKSCSFMTGEGVEIKSATLTGGNGDGSISGQGVQTKCGAATAEGHLGRVTVLRPRAPAVVAGPASYLERYCQATVTQTTVVTFYAVSDLAKNLISAKDTAILEPGTPFFLSSDRTHGYLFLGSQLMRFDVDPAFISSTCLDHVEASVFLQFASYHDTASATTCTLNPGDGFVAAAMTNYGNKDNTLGGEEVFARCGFYEGEVSSVPYTERFLLANSECPASGEPGGAAGAGGGTAGGAAGQGGAGGTAGAAGQSEGGQGGGLSGGQAGQESGGASGVSGGSGEGGASAAGQAGSGGSGPLKTSKKEFLTDYCPATLKQSIEVNVAQLVPGQLTWQPIGSRTLASGSLVFPDTSSESSSSYLYGFLDDGTPLSFDLGSQKFDWATELQFSPECPVPGKSVPVFFGDTKLYGAQGNGGAVCSFSAGDYIYGSIFLNTKPGQESIGGTGVEAACGFSPAYGVLDRIITLTLAPPTKVLQITPPPYLASYCRATLLQDTAVEIQTPLTHNTFAIFLAKAKTEFVIEKQVSLSDKKVTVVGYGNLPDGRTVRVRKLGSGDFDLGDLSTSCAFNDTREVLMEPISLYKTATLKGTPCVLQPGSVLDHSYGNNNKISGDDIETWCGFKDAYLSTFPVPTITFPVRLGAALCGEAEAGVPPVSAGAMGSNP